MRFLFKKLFMLCLVTFILFLTIPALAQNTQAINLKDGTILKGRVIEVRNGYYTIQTKLTGPVTIHEKDIVSINNIDNLTSQSQASFLDNTPSGLNLANPQSARNVQQEVNSLSQNLLNDPEIRSAMEELTRDPEMMQIMGNQNLLKAILGGNSTTMQNDPNVQELLRHPKMQKLMNMISQRILSSSGLNANPTGFNQ